MKKFLFIILLIAIFNTASASDFLFTEYSESPVLSPDGSGFDAVRVSNPQVIHVGSVYKMFYGGLGSGNALQVGLAESSNGIDWNFYSNVPVYRCGENLQLSCFTGGTWSSYRVVPEMVMYEDGLYKMWYLGNNQNLYAKSWLGYATSTDGYIWSAYKSNPIFPNNSGEILQYIGLLKHDSNYLLYYRSTFPDGDIRVAQSSDGINWTELLQYPNLPREVYAINSIGNTVVAFSGQFYASSRDGINFEQDMDVSSVFKGDGLISLIYEDESVKVWQSRIVSPGSIQMGIYYSTTTLMNLGLESDDNEPVNLSKSIDQLQTIVASIPDKSVRNSLEANLKKVLGFFENGQLQAAWNQLDALLKKVEQDKQQGKISDAVAEQIIEIGTAALKLIDDAINADNSANDVPLITQITSPYPTDSSTWSNELYAGGTASDSCGTTIGQCGCAISSMAMLGQYYGVKQGIDGQSLTPLAINSWLENNAGYTADGSVIWSKILSYFGHKVGNKTVTNFLLTGHNVTDKNVVDSFLDQSQPVVAFNQSKGHYFVLTDSLSSGYSVRDPFWYETKTTDDVKDVTNHIQDYNNVIDKANLFTFSNKPQVLAKVIEIHLGSPAELLLTDSQGRRAGYDPATGEVLTEIPGSSYDQAEGIYTNSTNSNPHLDKVLMVIEPISETYSLEVIGTGDGDYNLTVATTDSETNTLVNKVKGVTATGQVDNFVIDTEPTNGHLWDLIQQIKALVSDNIEYDWLLKRVAVIEDKVEKGNVVAGDKIISNVLTKLGNGDYSNQELMTALEELKAVLSQ